MLSSFSRNEGWNYIGRMNVSPGKTMVSLKISLKFIEEHNESYIIDVAGVPASLWTQ